MQSFVADRKCVRGDISVFSEGIDVLAVTTPLLTTYLLSADDLIMFAFITSYHGLYYQKINLKYICEERCQEGSCMEKKQLNFKYHCSQ